MKSPSELLGRLHRLNARDRAWIVEHLSEKERARLMSSLTEPAPAAIDTPLKGAEHKPQHDVRSVDAARQISRIEPRRVALAARLEPAWVCAAIAATQDATWQGDFLEALPASLRADVERMHVIEFGQALRESVTRLILARCQDDVPVESAFQRLVEHLISSRSRKRMTLHL